MATLEALHAAILASPDDESRRLAYADAVAPTDVARAELIKLQLVLAQWRREHTRPATEDQAIVRESELLKVNAERWEQRLAGKVDKAYFLRGFIEVVKLDAAKFLATAPQLYATAPILHLDLTGVKPVAAQLFASPYLDRIQSLQMRKNDLGDVEAAHIASSEHLRNIRWLSVANNEIGQAGLEALVASSAFPALGYLEFRFNKADDPTPRDADEYSTTSAAANQLMATYGSREWLIAKPRLYWPPPRDAV